MLLIASRSINLAFHILELQVERLSLQRTHQTPHSQHVYLTVLVFLVNGRHILMLQQHHRTLNLPILLCDSR